MNGLAVGAWLVLAAVAGLTVAPLDAQEPTSAQTLSDRLRQVQAVGREAPLEATAGESPALGEDQVRTLVREGLGVEVLKIEAVESERGPAYAVTVMNPPGDDNGAFLVETLVVDGVSGEVLGRVLQRPRVASGLATPSGQADFDGGLEIRRRSLR